MSENEKSLEKLFPKNEGYTFLVGAGISMDPPSSLPSATELSRVIIDELVPDDRTPVRKFLSIASQISNLRYEMIIEDLQRFVDKDLSILDFLNLITEPNLNHLFLADVLIHGHFVITTNFDYLVELALKRVLSEKDHFKIHPVITKDDYESFQDPQKMFNEGEYPLYKIHGSKMNIINGQNTLFSLITTMSALGRNREPGTSFIIEPYKNPAFENLMKGRSLIIMGYSGSDDFDISPMLTDLTDLNRLIWIEHCNEDIIEISPVNPQVKVDSQNEEGLITSPHNSTVVNLLKIIKSNCNVEVLRVKTNTIKFIYWYLWDWFIPDNQKEMLLKKQKDISVPDFKDFLRELDSIKEMSLLDKYMFATNIAFTVRRYDLIDGYVNPYKETYSILQDLIEKEGNLSAKAFFLVKHGINEEILGLYDKSLGLYSKALDIYESINDSTNEADCLNKIGILHQKSYQYDTALKYMEEALNIAGINGISDIKAEALRYIGNVYQTLNEFEKSLSYYKQSLQIIEELGDFYNKTLLLGNIGKNYELIGEFKVANEYYKKAIRIVNQLNIKELKPIFSTYEGNILKAQGDYEAALKRYKYSVDIYGHNMEYYNIMYSELDVCGIYELQGNFKKALSIYNDILSARQEFWPKGDVLNDSLNNKLEQIIQNKIEALNQ